MTSYEEFLDNVVQENNKNFEFLKKELDTKEKAIDFLKYCGIINNDGSLNENYYTED